MKNSLYLIGVILSAILSIQGGCEFEHEIQALDDFNQLFAEFIDTTSSISNRWEGLVDNYGGLYHDLINENSANWQEKADTFAVLFGEFNATAEAFLLKLDSIDEELDETARGVIYELSGVLRASISLGSANFICASDILSHRIVGILNLIEFNYGIAEIGYDPSLDENNMLVCAADILCINLSKPQDTWNFFSIPGYRLPDTDELIVKLIGSNGIEEEPLIEVGMFNRNGDYLISVNLQACSQCTESKLRLFKQFSIGIERAGSFIPMIELPIKS